MAKALDYVRRTEPEFSGEHQFALAEFLANIRLSVFNDYINRGERWGKIPPQVKHVRKQLWWVGFAAAFADRVSRWEHRVGLGIEPSEVDPAEEVEMLKRMASWGIKKSIIRTWLVEHTKATYPEGVRAGRVHIYRPQPGDPYYDRQDDPPGEYSC